MRFSAILFFALLAVALVAATCSAQTPQAACVPGAPCPIPPHAAVLLAPSSCASQSYSYSYHESYTQSIGVRRPFQPFRAFGRIFCRRSAMATATARCGN